MKAFIVAAISRFRHGELRRVRGDADDAVRMPGVREGIPSPSDGPSRWFHARKIGSLTRSRTGPA